MKELIRSTTSLGLLAALIATGLGASSVAFDRTSASTLNATNTTTLFGNLRGTLGTSFEAAPIVLLLVAGVVLFLGVR
jgi:hypothetical protein